MSTEALRERLDRVSRDLLALSNSARDAAAHKDPYYRQAAGRIVADRYELLAGDIHRLREGS